MFNKYRPSRTGTSSVPGPDYAQSNPVSASDPVASACAVILAAAGATDWPLAEADQHKMVRRARGRTHPDRHGGDRMAWDQVQAAAAILRVP